MKAYITIFLILLVSNAHGLIISEFCPDTALPDDADEYVVLEGHESLDSVMVSDGEGSFRFPEGAKIDGKLVISMNGEAYRSTHNSFPDYEYYNSSSYVSDVIPSGRFKLANSKDEIILYKAGKEIERVSWPRDVKPRKEQVHYFKDGTWDPVPYFTGQSRFNTTTFTDVSGTAFLSPDCSYEIFRKAIESAHESVFVNVYEFTSTDMAEDLVRAHNRGVNVSVLVEGVPVGGMSSNERYACSQMNTSGIPIYQMGVKSVKKGVKKTRELYRYDHAKYIIIDNSQVFITSENFKSNGFPAHNESGNRGWGLLVRSPELAAYFFQVYAHDSEITDIHPFEAGKGESEVCDEEVYQEKIQPYSFKNATIIPVLAPDTSDGIKSLIDGATQSIDIEQAYIKNETGGGLNRFLKAALDRSRKGVKVRVLLDSYYYNVQDNADNDEMVKWINRYAKANSLPVEARCIDLEKSKLLKIHNKGVIVDGSFTLISSINWNTNSPDFNRETGIIILDNKTAQYFSEAFSRDWEDPVKKISNGPDFVKIMVAVFIIGMLLVIYGIRRYKRR